MTHPTVLVTGGAGFIGSHACKALAKVGYCPVTVDDLSGGWDQAVRWGLLERCDLRDTVRLDDVFRTHRPLAVLHFAGISDVAESVADPNRYHQINVGSTRSLLTAMAAHGVKVLVQSSSASVYGEPDVMPIPEHHPLRPVNPYGQTKALAEALADQFLTSHGIRSMSLRYFNAAGADPEGELGERHQPETHLIPLALQVAAGQRSNLFLHGDDFPTPDGTCVRDFVHVSDLVDAHVLALRSLLRGDRLSPALNLGNGAGFSVRQVIQAVQRITGCPVPVQVAPRRAGDPPCLLADASLAQRELGWAPRFPRLEQQISHAWAWLQACQATHSQQCHSPSAPAR